MANNWAAHMGKESGRVRSAQAQEKLIASGQTKIVDTLTAQLPGAAGLLKTAGLSEKETWAMATHPETLRGIKVVLETLGGALKFLDKVEKPKGRGKKTAIPLIPYTPE